MFKYFRKYKQKYFNCPKGNHIYIGIPNGTACLVCKWKDI